MGSTDDELRELLNAAGIEFDEKYPLCDVWHPFESVGLFRLQAIWFISLEHQTVLLRAISDHLRMAISLRY